MKITEQQISMIDDNETKAREILKGILRMSDDEAEELVIGGVDVGVLIGIAFEYLERNNKVFSEGL